MKTKMPIYRSALLRGQTDPLPAGREFSRVLRQVRLGVTVARIGYGKLAVGICLKFDPIAFLLFIIGDQLVRRIVGVAARLRIMKLPEVEQAGGGMDHLPGRGLLGFWCGINYG